MKEDKTMLELKNVKFVNFGARVCPPRKYLSINLFGDWVNTDRIHKWLKINNVDGGVVRSNYCRLESNEVVIKYRFGLDRHTKIVDSSGKKVPKKKFVIGNSIDLIARIYPDTHWRGLGVKRLVEKIVVHDNGTK